MKKILIATAALLVTVGAYAQGEVNFNNRVGTTVDARVLLPTGAGVGAGYTAQLFGAPQTSIEANLVGLTPTTTFRTSSAAAEGYINGISVVVPGVPANAVATLQMRVFDSTGALVGKSNMIDVQLGGGVSVTPNMVGLTGFTISTPDIPEPSTIVLAALGGLGLLAIRRRK